jgi:hypothetical protein
MDPQVVVDAPVEFLVAGERGGRAVGLEVYM